MSEGPDKGQHRMTGSIRIIKKVTKPKDKEPKK
jgi:hypothetical protein